MSPPSYFQSILLAVHQSLACKWLGNSELKKKFIQGDCSLDKLNEIQFQLLTDIFRELEISITSFDDAKQNITEFAQSLIELSKHLWTFNASSKQVIWMLMTHHYIPGITRHLAFWHIDERSDKGMPGGKFWYLPEYQVVENKPQVILPCSQVIEWLLDLLGVSIESLANSVDNTIEDSADNLKRSLYKWMNGTLPEASTIKKYFADSVSLDFNGTFTLNIQDSLENQYQSAVAFISAKKLTIEQLKLEIPISKDERLVSLLNGDASEEEKRVFIHCLAERYSRPSMKVIRQRLLIARAVQDGYIRLLNYLCPSVDRLCADPKQNKILQAIAIYKLVFNLTIEAHNQVDFPNEAQENLYFEQKINPMLKDPLLLSILPSLGQDGIRCLASAMRIYFREMMPTDSLIDVLAIQEDMLKSTLEQQTDYLQTYLKEKKSVEFLCERISRASPWRTLQKEDNFWVVSEVIQQPKISIKAKLAAIERLQEVAKDNDQRVLALCVELENTLAELNLITAKERVKQLIDKIDTIEHTGIWNPSILRFKAIDALYQNKFKDAEKYFRRALDECNRGQYGTLKAELARDALSVAVAMNKVNSNNHTKYLKIMLLEGFLDIPSSNGRFKMPKIEDVAVSCAEYFWDTLYKTYLQHQKISPPSANLFEESLKYLFEQDSKGLISWFQRNRSLLQKSMADTRGDTLLLLWIKMYNSFSKKLPVMRYGLPHELQDEYLRFEKWIEFWQSCIALLIEEIPKSINVCDFKAQSALMLAAESGNTFLFNILLKAGADPNLQDYEGRTALHAAVKSGDINILNALINHPCNPELSTIDGMTALHTACWKGNFDAIEELMKKCPKLIQIRNIYGDTPLEFVERLIDDEDFFQNLNQDIQKKGHDPLCIKQLQKIFHFFKGSGDA